MNIIEPIINIREINEPNFELMAKALINLYAELELSLSNNGDSTNVK
ncbi:MULTISPECIES: hypothetical protein [Cytobacillus]|nr:MULTISPECIES: hypothetical protein [Cytobacillus]MCM3394880.1 hypothetical protein [Cytobacillus oceanisediminis]UQX56040.1 hypothetical protein M5V91_10660 [Cytobacillus pseudoceanisediminis]